VSSSVRPDVAALQARFGDDIRKVKEDRGDTFVCVDRRRIVEIARFLKEEPGLGYDYFSECLGVDYAAWRHERDFDERFEVVYNLMNHRTGGRIFIKVGVDDGQTVPTLKDVFLGAEYPEREVQDLFGIVFEGNGPVPGERFLLPDDWIGFPLRKEFPLGGEDVVFAHGTKGPAVEDLAVPHAGESFEGKTGTEETGVR
jgi:NADH-quinone oxidoreductase subunit C